MVPRRKCLFSHVKTADGGGVSLVFPFSTVDFLSTSFPFLEEVFSDDLELFQIGSTS